jgi:2-polyprenyl-6-methoxyphenol hydroxylase-like FAD-dependent oxidoreductase
MLSLSHQNIPVVIIGGGIHGMSIAMRLIRDLEKRQISGAAALKHLVILDRDPQPLTAWLRKTQRQGMTFLRSPAVHHVGMDALGIVEYARNHDRTDELAPPYSQPSTDLFLDFCRHEINQQQIRSFYYHFDVANLRWDKGGSRFPFRIISQHNEGFRARCVILAMGSDDCSYMPPEFVHWRDRFPERIVHSRDFDLQAFGQRHEHATFPKEMQKVVIIGGGLTAGTLAKCLVEQGTQVVSIARNPLRIQQFDFQPSWLGPKAIKAFNNEPDWEKRYEVIQQARGKGSVTPDIAEALERYAITTKNFQRCIGAKVLHIKKMNRLNQLQLNTTQRVIDAVDLIVLATGYRFNLRKYAFLSNLIEQHQVATVRGLPLLDENLQLLPVENLFGSGVIAQLQLGPASGNIAGAALAYDRFQQKVLRATSAIQ